MKELIKNALDEKNWAVLGASDKPDRFGYKITKRLIDRGYEVTPINPNYDELLGVPAYKTIEDSGKAIDVVDVVINKKLSKEWVQNTDLSQFKAVWFQPGSFDEEVIELAKEKNPNIIYDACVLVETN